MTRADLLWFFYLVAGCIFFILLVLFESSDDVQLGGNCKMDVNILLVTIPVSTGDDSVFWLSPSLGFSISLVLTLKLSCTI